MSSSRQLNPIEFIGMSDQVVAFTNHSFVAGPGLVAAYQLECTYAKSPRVIFDPKIPKYLSLNADEFLSLINDKNKIELIKIDTNDQPSESSNFHIIHFFNFFERDWKVSEQSAEKVSHYLKQGLDKRTNYYSKYLWIINYLKSIPFSENVKKHFHWIN